MFSGCRLARGSGSVCFGRVTNTKSHTDKVLRSACSGSTGPRAEITVPLLLRPPARPAGPGGSRRVPARSITHRPPQPPLNSESRYKNFSGCFVDSGRPCPARLGPARSGRVSCGTVYVCVCECVCLLPFFLRGLACFRLLQRGPSAMISCFIDK